MNGLAVQIHRDELGLAGKVMITSLVVLAAIGVFAVDAGSIAVTKFHVDDLATEASATAADSYRDTHKASEACAAASDSVTGTDPDARIPRDGCVINIRTGFATITVRKRANTLFAGRLGVTKPYTKVEATETSGPNTL